MAAVKKIADAIKSIPGKKESLRESLELLKFYSSSLATFTLEWKEVDDHLSVIEKSINERFKALEAKEEKLLPLGISEDTGTTNKSDKFAIFRKEEEEEVSPRPELKSLCVRMDAKGLATFMEKLRPEEMSALRKELSPALRLASDPAQLVLDAVGFHSKPSNIKSSGSEVFSARNTRNCTSLLEALQPLAPEIGPAMKERALLRASEWKARIVLDKGGDRLLEVIAFLQLIASFDIVAKFDQEDILELFSFVSRRNHTLGLVKSLGLINNLPELIKKLSSKGRQLDAVKIICAYDMTEKFPPVPLLEAYVRDSKKSAEEIQKSGKHSRQSQNEAVAKEIGALQSVAKLIEDYKLENEYPCRELEKRISELKRRGLSKKRDAAGASIYLSKTQLRQQQRQRSNQRSRELASAPVHRPMPANNPYPPSIQNHPQRGLADRASYMAGPYGLTASIQNHPQHGLADHASYMAGPYGSTASGSVYNHADPSLSGGLINHSGARSPPKPYLYSSEAFAAPNGLYDQPVTYSGYPPSGLPPSYGSSLYP